jgi:hypothetical protein
MFDLAIDIQAGHVNAAVEAMDNFMRKLGKTTEDAVHFAGWAFSRSLGASCKRAPKLRKIVKNPDKRKGDTRQAPYGVMKWHKGEQKFDPIYRGGEYGAKIKFVSRNKTLLKVGSEWVEYKAGEDEATGINIPGIKDHPKRKINRSGMAAQSFQRLGVMAKSRSGTNSGVMNIHGVLSTSVSGKYANTRLTLTNHLRYITEALQGGKKDVATATLRAADAINGYVKTKTEGRQR